MGAHHHQTIEVDYATRTDGQPVYVGYADPGSAGDTDKPVWAIMRIDYDMNDLFVQRVWAMLEGQQRGNVYYDKIWDDRTSYTYN